MMRKLWDRVMIGLMAIVIFVCGQELLASPAPLSEVRCLVASGLACLVIVFKIQALKNAPADE
jgi:hypothetical protein